MIIERHKKPIAELRPVNTGEQPVPKLSTNKGKIKIVDPNWAATMTDALSERHAARWIRFRFTTKIRSTE